ncbi:MAG: winged helix-turn-helix transcriptional regulator [Parasporobacterium sp.]|nr:winged helix-turn-helix transcriptional regulator [Parasporobacterium sp.]MBR3643087.1 winged helix-turn-helix transcriptional regulator [Parasporobacterium sp.]
MNQLNLPHEHGEGEQIKMLAEQLSDMERFQAIAEIFKRLGDANRIRIFWLLCNCEECVINISAILNISSPAASHHLKLLKESKLISSRRDGKEVYYKASGTKESLLLRHLLEMTIDNFQ